MASERIYGWIEDGIVSSGDIDPASADQVMSALEDHPEVEASVGSLVEQFVSALFVEEGEEATVELTDSLAPIVPLVASTLAAHDWAIDEGALTAALARTQTVDLDTGSVATVADAFRDARSLLSVIVALASLTLVLTGSAAVWLSPDRLAMVRTLAARVVLSALSFAVLFRVGAWVLDPQRGGSPIAAGGSILLDSNAQVFLLAAIAGGAVIIGIAWYVRRIKRPPSRPNDAFDVDDDSRELITV